MLAAAFILAETDSQSFFASRFASVSSHSSLEMGEVLLSGGVLTKEWGQFSALVGKFSPIFGIGEVRNRYFLSLSSRFIQASRPGFGL